MSYDLNKVFVSGNLTDDPNVFEFANGDKAANFSIAINKTWTGEDGQENKKTTFVDCRASGRYMQKKIEAIGKYLRKGRKVLVEGSLELNKYKKNDQTVSKMRVLIDEFHFMDSKSPSEIYPDEIDIPGSEAMDKEKDMFPIIDPNYDEIA